MCQCIYYLQPHHECTCKAHLWSERELLRIISEPAVVLFSAGVEVLNMCSVQQHYSRKNGSWEDRVAYFDQSATTDGPSHGRSQTPSCKVLVLLVRSERAGYWEVFCQGVRWYSMKMDEWVSYRTLTQVMFWWLLGIVLYFTIKEKTFSFQLQFG